VLSRVLSREDWARCQHYAPKIREIEFSDTAGGQLHRFLDAKVAESILQLSRLQQTTTLLPNVQKISWTLSSNTSLSGLIHFISPSLTSLHVCVKTLTVIPDLSGLVSVCEAIGTPLRDFSLWCLTEFDHTHGEALAGQLSRILRSCTNITSLATEVQILERLLPTFDLLCGLKELSLSEEVLYAPPDPSPLSFPADAFPVLNSVAGEGFAFWNRFLPHAGSSVESVFMQDQGENHTVVAATSADFIIFIRILGDHCGSLRFLELKSLRISTDEEGELVGLLRPLLQCSHLEQPALQFSPDEDAGFDFCYTLSDQDVKQMATSWPSLTTLEICTNFDPYHENPKPPLTLQAISLLRQHCASLSSLALTMDASNPPPPANVHSAATTLPMLDKLGLEGSVLSSPARVAVWLQDICLAENVSWVEWVDDERRIHQWEDMKVMLEHLQKVKEERPSPSEEFSALQRENEALRQNLKVVKEMVRKIMDTIDSSTFGHDS
jgi:hypothetical protein